MTCAYRFLASFRPFGSLLAGVVLVAGCGGSEDGTDSTSNLAGDATEVNADEETRSDGPPESAVSDDGVADQGSSSASGGVTEPSQQDTTSELSEGDPSAGNANTDIDDAGTDDAGTDADANEADAAEANATPGPVEDGGGDVDGAGQPLDPDYEGGPCPSTAPALDSACAEFGIFCTYGVGDAGCRERFSCHVTNVWINGSVGGEGLCLPPPSDCTTPPEGPCDDTTERCVQDDEVCYCRGPQTESCSGDGCTPLDPPIPQQWVCEPEPTVAEGCPAEIPNAGSRCDDETKTCLYGSIYTVCVDGYYAWERNVMP